MKLILLTYLFSILQIAFAGLAHNRNFRRDPTLKPSQDPFYQPPDGFEKNYKLGEVINSRQRTDPFGVFFIKENFKAAYQLLVRSEGSLGEPTAIVTTVLVPHNANSSRVLSYHTAEDSADIDCAPSYAMQIDSTPDTWITASVEQLLAQVGLYNGWYVVIPDFEGPKASYTAGWQAGRASLDSLKAVVTTQLLTGVDPNPEITLWGYSGGSQPSIWAAALAPQYAPDLNIIGAAAGGVIVDIDNIARHAFNSPLSGLVISAINGLSHEYPALETFLKANIRPQAWAIFENNNNECLAVTGIVNAFSSWDEITSLGEGILDTPAVRNVTSSNNILNLNQIPKIPILLYNSVTDEIIPYGPTDDLYSKWCSAGVSVAYHQDVIGGHVITDVTGAGGAVNWLKDRFSGVTQSGCQKIFEATNLSGNVLEEITVVVDILKTLFGDSIGPTELSTLIQLIGDDIRHGLE